MADDESFTIGNDMVLAILLIISTPASLKQVDPVSAIRNPTIIVGSTPMQWPEKYKLRKMSDAELATYCESKHYAVDTAEGETFYLSESLWQAKVLDSYRKVCDDIKKNYVAAQHMPNSGLISLKNSPSLRSFAQSNMPDGVDTPQDTALETRAFNRITLTDGNQSMEYDYSESSHDPDFSVSADQQRQEMKMHPLKVTESTKENQVAIDNFRTAHPRVDFNWVNTLECAYFGPGLRQPHVQAHAVSTAAELLAKHLARLTGELLALQQQMMKQFGLPDYSYAKGKGLDQLSAEMRSDLIRGVKEYFHGADAEKFLSHCTVSNVQPVIHITGYTPQYNASVELKFGQ